jgi:hypothetical protein
LLVLLADDALLPVLVAAAAGRFALADARLTFAVADSQSLLCAFALFICVMCICFVA